jgi:signal transduction histidine kinase
MNKIWVRFEKLLDVEFAETDLPKLSQDEQRRIRLVNYIGLITIVNMLSYVIIYAVVDFLLFQYACIILSIASAITIGIIIINKQGNHHLAKILLSVLTPFYMAYIAIVVFGKAPGFQVYLFVAAIIPLFLWSYKQKKYPVLLISAILIVYTLIEFFPPVFQPSIVLPETYIYYFRLTNVSVCFLAAGIAIGTYQFLYRKKEEQLIKQTKELKISQAHKDKVYSIIAHDLRTPFGTFAGLTDLFIEEYDEYSDENRLEIIQSMQHASVSLQNLLENLLDWSRMQSGNLEKSLAHLNLRKLAEESLALHKELIQKKEHKTEIDIDSDLMIYADQHMVSTVFRNLISNAIKFTKQRGKIFISAKGNHKKISVCVKDSGIGLAEKDLKNLFDIRSTSKITGASREKGSGLGLLLCKDFIESHEGKVWVESKIGKGSKFCFTLPKSMDQGRTELK